MRVIWKTSLSCISLCLLLEACNGGFEQSTPIKYSLANLLLQLPQKPEALDYDKLAKTITDIHDSIEGKKGLFFREDAQANDKKRLETMHRNCNKERLPEELRTKEKVTPETCADGTENYRKIYNEHIVNKIMKAYDVKAIKDVASTIRDYIISVRKDNLYGQVARFVGRVNCNEYNTGTGTVIGWKGMPKELKGRVVLSAAHNHSPFLEYSDANKRKEDKYFNTHVANEVYKCTLNRTLTGGKDKMSFMLDLNDGDATSDDELLRNATALPPGFGHGNMRNRQEVDVECVYVPLVAEKPEDLTIYGDVRDIAIYILKKSVCNEFLDIEDYIEDVTTDAGLLYSGENTPPTKDLIDKGPRYFAIGYGMADSLTQFDYFTKFITGWNLKKRTYDFYVGVYDYDPYNVYINPLPNMPSNSGGPVVRKGSDGNYKICALFNGSNNTKLKPFVEWIKDVVKKHDADERKN